MADWQLQGLAVQRVALPLHIQKLQQLLNLGPLIGQVEKTFRDDHSAGGTLGGVEVRAGVSFTGQTVSNAFLYNFKHVTRERKWLQDLLLSDSDGSESDLSETEQLQLMLELQYRRKKRWKRRVKHDPKLMRYKYFSAGLLSRQDRYPDHIDTLEEQLTSGETVGPLREGSESLDVKRRKDEEQRSIQREKERYRLRLWAFIAKKEIPKMAKQFATARHNTFNNNRRVAQLCQREVKKLAMKSQRASKEVTLQPRVRRLTREALIYWRRYERVEKEQRRKAEREAVEQRKIDDEMREVRRQQRKLNFLITQTELYAHFMAKKLKGELGDNDSEEILQQLEDTPLQREVRPGMVVDLERPDEYDSAAMKAQALNNVHSAFKKLEENQQTYNQLVRQGLAEEEEGEMKTDLQESFDQRFSLATPFMASDVDLPQPAMFKGQLKAYQLKGMTWLANLYDQGINGILADEMGLGKTVQSISLLAHLAERQNIWGPFLIVAPASTLHNWQQECTRFVPRFKVLPYWGSPHERKVIRKYWNQKLLYKENAPFHILITSYQLIVQDIKYFQRVRWQYMILDEAQAIKSSSSVRWKVLLSFNCRNRLLLTGTPIQNTMQELWALLHFIMPTLFDSHEEFNEWFSRDIESHAEKKSMLDENQLSRLHLILKPFMLRRIKRDVEHEMAEKIEVHLSCNLSTRQQRLYHGLRQRISMEDLLQYSKAQANNNSTGGKESTSHLLNLVMQFRKVCNHPDLFERREVDSPISVPIPSYGVPRLLCNDLQRYSAERLRLLTTTLGLHSTQEIHCSSLHVRHSRSKDAAPLTATSPSPLWSFLRLTDTTPQEASTVMLGSLTARLHVVLALAERVHLLYQQKYWGSKLSQPRYSCTQLLLWPEFRTSYPAVACSPVLRELVFTSHTQSTYTHATHRIFPLKTSATTSAELTEISSTISNPEGGSEAGSSASSTPGDVQSASSTLGDAQSASVMKETVRHPLALVNGLTHNASEDSTMNSTTLDPQERTVATRCTPDLVIPNSTESSRGNGKIGRRGEVGIGDALLCRTKGGGKSVSPARLDHAPVSLYQCMPTEMPRFLTAYVPKVRVPTNPSYCSDRSAEYTRLEWLTGGPRDLVQLLYHGPPRAVGRAHSVTPTPRLKLGEQLHPPPPAGLDAVRPQDGWFHIHIPDKDNMIYDSGKMAVLDKLLAQLKREGHRVLVYSQMTRMIDLLEEFMAYRRYTYIRLDGSSRIADRRDMVDDFQKRSDIFIFLLSTRAGGLGINLTAADTVIFYDSDWNPTVDQQAMDRAHRLGQTKQVTVYRLIVKGSIEERILQRAREKSEIQKMVISGGNFRPDDLKAKEMVSLLLDDDEMETRFLARQAEKRALEEQQVDSSKKTKNKKRKNQPNGKESEPFPKRTKPGLVSGSPSPLIFSRPDSVMSGISEVNGVDDNLDVGSVDSMEEVLRPGSTPVRKRQSSKGKRKTSVPLGGRGKMQRKKFSAIGSGSAAASAGALAAALAANTAAYTAYGLSPRRVSPSPSSVSGSPANMHSTHSSPRASPVPGGSVSLSQTPPGAKASKNSLAYTNSIQ